MRELRTNDCAMKYGAETPFRVILDTKLYETIC